MLNAPTRLSQPHLQPDKLNGALWFAIDSTVHSFIRATWQGYYMGQWRSWKYVPQDRRDVWWQTFVQNYYWEPQFTDLVYGLWKKETRTSICERISKKKRQKKKPKYINDDDWTYLMEYWVTEPTRKKSKKAAVSRKSDPEGKGVHTHSAGHMLDGDGDERPPYTDLVKKTHTRKDGTYVDYRAEEMVKEAVKEATKLSNTDGSPESPGTTSGPSRLMLNKAYLKTAKAKKGHVYGLGSAQYRENPPSLQLPSALSRNIELEMHVAKSGDEHSSCHD